MWLQFGKARIRGHYRKDLATGRMVYVKPYEDRRPASVVGEAHEQAVAKLEQKPAAADAETSMQAPVAKEPWQMTRKEFREFVEAQGNVRTNSPLSIGNYMIPETIKIRDREYGFHYFSTKRHGHSMAMSNEIAVHGPGIPQGTKRTAQGSQSNTDATFVLREIRKAEIRRALEAGESIPSEVLAEYPDLQKALVSGEALAPASAHLRKPEDAPLLLRLGRGLRLLFKGGRGFFWHRGPHGQRGGSQSRRRANAGRPPDWERSRYSPDEERVQRIWQRVVRQAYREKATLKEAERRLRWEMEGARIPASLIEKTIRLLRKKWEELFPPPNDQPSALTKARADQEAGLLAGPPAWPQGALPSPAGTGRASSPWTQEYHRPGAGARVWLRFGKARVSWYYRRDPRTGKPVYVPSHEDTRRAARQEVPQTHQPKQASEEDLSQAAYEGLLLTLRNGERAFEEAQDLATRAFIVPRLVAQLDRASNELRASHTLSQAHYEQFRAEASRRINAMQAALRATTPPTPKTDSTAPQPPVESAPSMATPEATSPLPMTMRDTPPSPRPPGSPKPPYELMESEYLDQRLAKEIDYYEVAIAHAEKQLAETIAPKTRQSLEVSLPWWKERLARLQARDPREVTSFLKDYEKTVKTAISKGHPVPQAVIDQRPEFKKAQTARQRYEKGRHTSFANRSIAVSEAPKAVRGYKIKRQDGKPMTDELARDVEQGVNDVETVLGPLKDIFEAADLTIVHTNGKHPFLSDAGGIYHDTDKTVSVGVADRIGRPVRALAHELGHLLDFMAGAAMGHPVRQWRAGSRKATLTTSLAEYEQRHDLFSGLLAEARRKINHVLEVKRLMSAKLKDQPTEEGKADLERVHVALGPYWREPAEIWARLMEQYVATKLGRGGPAADTPESYGTKPGWWTKDDFEGFMPQIEQELQRRLTMVRTHLTTQRTTDTLEKSVRTPLGLRFVKAVSPSSPSQALLTLTAQDDVHATEQGEAIDKEAVDLAQQVIEEVAELVARYHAAQAQADARTAAGLKRKIDGLLAHYVLDPAVIWGHPEEPEPDSRVEKSQGGRPWLLFKAHVKGHYRRVGGKTVYVQPHEDKRTRRTAVQDYLNEMINFGGTLTTRGEAIRQMQAEGHDQRRIDAYMMGAKTIKKDDALGYQFRTAEGKDAIQAVDEWLAEPDKPLTEEEWNRPVYDARGKLLARTRREFEENVERGGDWRKPAAASSSGATTQDKRNWERPIDQRRRQGGPGEAPPVSNAKEGGEQQLAWRPNGRPEVIATGNFSGTDYEFAVAPHQPYGNFHIVARRAGKDEWEPAYEGVGRTYDEAIQAFVKRNWNRDNVQFHDPVAKAHDETLRKEHQRQEETHAAEQQREAERLAQYRTQQEALEHRLRSVKFTKQSFQASTGSDPVTVSGLAHAGLLVHRPLDYDPRGKYGPSGWDVSHHASGRKLAHYDSQQEAKVAAMRLAGLQDWSQDAATLQRLVKTDKALAEKIGALVRDGYALLDEPVTKGVASLLRRLGTKLVAFFKSHVPLHQRRTKTGRVVMVREHVRRDSATIEQVKRGLKKWVEEYKVARRAGNVSLARQLKQNIDRHIARYGLDRQEVYGDDPERDTPYAERRAAFEAAERSRAAAEALRRHHEVTKAAILAQAADVRANLLKALDRLDQDLAGIKLVPSQRGVLLAERLRMIERLDQLDAQIRRAEGAAA